MTTNKEWLFSLPLDEQYAWMNQEHVEGENGTLEATTAAADAKCQVLAQLLGECMAERDQAKLAYNELRGKVLDVSDRLYHIASCDGGLA